MKTLYVSDLDGTLMQPDARLSPRTVALLNGAVADGKQIGRASCRERVEVCG